MYTEAISDTLWGLLQRLNEMPFIKSCYLGGGTALALQLGHRRSEDLDLFLPPDLDQNTPLREMKDAGIEAVVLTLTQNHLVVTVGGLRFDMIREQIPLLFPLRPIHSQLPNLQMADSKDIGRMKIIAVGSRGAKKDFVDLYCLTRKIMSLESLIMLATEEQKGIQYSKVLFLKGLVDFEEADKEAEISMIWNIGWKEVKTSLEEEVKGIAEKLGV